MCVVYLYFVQSLVIDDCCVLAFFTFAESRGFSMHMQTPKSPLSCSPKTYQKCLKCLTINDLRAHHFHLKFEKNSGESPDLFWVGGTRSRACTPFFQRSGLPQIFIYQSSLKEEATVVRDFVGSSYTLTEDFFYQTQQICA